MGGECTVSNLSMPDQIPLISNRYSDPTQNNQQYQPIDNLKKTQINPI